MVHIFKRIYCIIPFDKVKYRKTEEKKIMSAENLRKLLNIICTEATTIVGSDLEEIILYGSYARGDFDSESDIDIALIVKTNRTDSVKYRKEIVNLMSDLSLDFDVLVSISCIPRNDFDRYKEVLPYYRNINCEGVRLSA